TPLHHALAHRHLPSFPTRRSSDLAIVRVEGWDRFLCAQRLGKGVIFGSAHLGPVALVGQVLMHRGYTLTLPAEKTDSELMHAVRSEEHTSEPQSRGHLVCRLLLEK